MSQAASQAAAFYRDVAAKKKVWTIEDADGVPAPMTAGGRRSMPFWSSLSRAEKIVKTGAACSGFRPRELAWQEFESKWLVGMKNDGYALQTLRPGGVYKNYGIGCNVNATMKFHMHDGACT